MYFLRCLSIHTFEEKDKVIHTKYSKKIQIELILLYAWAEPAVLGSAKTALKFKYEIQIGYYTYTIQCMGQSISFKSEINNP